MYWSDYTDANAVQQGSPQGSSEGSSEGSTPQPRRAQADAPRAERKLTKGPRRLTEDELPENLYTTPTQNSVYGGPKVPVVKIDLRARKAFYSYEVRTSDNVKLLLEGTIFWQVSDVRRMVNMTSDPEGDVWARSRSTLIQAVSNVTLAGFMNGFNDVVMNAFNADSHDTFYTDRGITLSSMELSRYSCVDEHTRQVLQQIIRETTRRINRLQKQRSDNEVRAERLAAEIQLESNRTQLIETRALNEKLLAETRGATDGGGVATGIASFIDGLNESLANVTGRMELYRLHKTLEAAKKDTQHLSGGNASLYIAPKEMDLRLDMPHQTAEL